MIRYLIFVYLTSSCLVQPSPYLEGQRPTIKVNVEDASFEDALNIFQDNIHPVLAENCGDCHGNATSPLFAIEDQSEAFGNLLDAQKIDFGDPKSSRILQRLKERHNCGGEDNCESLHETLLPHVEKISEILFEEDSQTSYTSNPVKLSSVRETELFINDDRNRFINLIDIFPEHVTDGLINVSQTPLELMLDYPDNVSFTSNIWVRYKDSSEAGNMEIFTEAGENITNPDLTIARSNSDWSWARINVADTKINSSFKLKFTGSIIVDKILLTDETKSTINNKIEVLSIDMSDELGFEFVVHFRVTLDNETLYKIGKPIVETSERVIFQDLKIYMNELQSTKSSIFSDLDLILEKGAQHVSEATDAITLDDSVEEPVVSISIERISKIGQGD